MSFVLVALIIGAVCCLPATCQHAVDFQTPDVTATVPTHGRAVHVEAFDATPAAGHTKRPGVLELVSLGAATIVRSPLHRKSSSNSSVSDAFEFDEGKVHVWIGLLSQSQRQALLAAAKTKHGEGHVQISPIRPSHVNCSMKIAGVAGTHHVLEGSASHPHSDPFAVAFTVPASSRARRILQERVSNDSADGVSLRCDFEVTGKQEESESLPTGLNRTQKGQVWSKLFGKKKDAVLVTLPQLRWLLTDVHTMEVSTRKAPKRLIAEEVDAVVDRVAHGGASGRLPAAMGVDEALASLSMYMLNATNSSAIMHDLNALFEVDFSSHLIRFNHAVREQLLRDGVLSSLPHASKTLLLHRFIRLGSLDRVLDWTNSTNLTDQLAHLNTLEDSDVVWKLDGDAVVADKLRVVQLLRPNGGEAALFHFNRHVHRRVSGGGRWTVDVDLKLEDHAAPATRHSLPGGHANPHHSEKPPVPPSPATGKLNADVKELQAKVDSIFDFVTDDHFPEWIKSRRSILDFAAKTGQVSLVKQLLKPKTKTTARKTKDSNRQLLLNALVIAIDNGHTEVAKELLKAPGAFVNMKTSDGRFPLLVASEKGNPDVAKALLDKGANVSLERSDGMNALAAALFRGHFRVAKILLHAAAKVDAELPGGLGPLSAASMSSKGDAELIDLLMKNGASRDERLPDGTTPLVLASVAGNLHVVKALLRHKVDVNAASADGTTALSAASVRNYTEIVEALQQHGATADKGGARVVAATEALKGTNKMYHVPLPQSKSSKTADSAVHRGHRRG